MTDDSSKSQHEPSTPPVALDYETPREERSLQEALTELIEQEVGAGRMKPPSLRWLLLGVVGLVVSAVLMVAAAYLLRQH